MSASDGEFARAIGAGGQVRFDRLLLVAFESAEDVEIEIFFASWMAACHFFVVIVCLSFARRHRYVF